MRDPEPTTVYFGRSSSVLYNNLDAPIELKPRSLSRGRSVLSKSALKKPKEWSRQESRSGDGWDQRLDLDVDEFCEIMHPPSCPKPTSAERSTIRSVVVDISKCRVQSNSTDQSSATDQSDTTERSDAVERSDCVKSKSLGLRNDAKQAPRSITQREIEDRFTRSVQSATEIASTVSAISKRSKHDQFVLGPASSRHQQLLIDDEESLNGYANVLKPVADLRDKPIIGISCSAHIGSTFDDDDDESTT